MFELIAIIGLSAILVSCAVNLFELAAYDPDQETGISEPDTAVNAAEKSVSVKEFIA